MMTFLPWQLYSLAVMFGIRIGVYLPSDGERYGRTRPRQYCLRDEFIGMWITLMALPTTDWQWVAAGFVIFRHSDMWENPADPLV
ncbi:phosphatidylglycerophosphatase A [Salmonella enterica subsp. enterica]|nr:phosphatidylglycerophosphatase A [Salmonella enterica subsp. enterica]